MADSKQLPARDRIVRAAAHLFYLEGIRTVSLDDIAKRAGLTKKTLYYYFASKDDLIAEYLTQRDAPNLKAYQTWFDEAGGRTSRRIEAIFNHLATAASHPKWRGCGFLRIAAELANMPGHPARVVGAAHKKRVESWLEAQFAEAGLRDRKMLARQISLLLDGAFSTMFMHRDASYAKTAGQAARTLLEQAEASR